MDLRGKFVYKGQTPIDSVCNLTVVKFTIRDWLSLLKEIAKHIKYRYQDTNETRPSLNDRVIERMVDRFPYKFLACSLIQYAKVGDLKEGENCGKYLY